MSYSIAKLLSKGDKVSPYFRPFRVKNISITENNDNAKLKKLRET